VEGNDIGRDYAALFRLRQRLWVLLSRLDWLRSRLFDDQLAGGFDLEELRPLGAQFHRFALALG